MTAHVSVSLPVQSLVELEFVARRALEVARENLGEDSPVVADMRSAQLALTGALRSVGFAPAADGSSWEKRPVRSRR